MSTKSRKRTSLRNALLAGAALGLLAGCGGGAVPATCTFTGFAMIVSPADPAAAPDHAASPPENQQRFNAGLGSPTGPEPCIFHPLYQMVPAQWTTSDPENVSISSALDATNGTATCLGTTRAAATVSATLTEYGFTETVSTPIVCK